MLQHEQIRQCVEELRVAIETGQQQKKELEEQLTQTMIQIRDLQTGLRIVAELSAISLKEEQEREAQCKAIQEKAAEVMDSFEAAHAACDEAEVECVGAPD